MDDKKKYDYWLDCYEEQDKKFAMLKDEESNIFIRSYVEYLIRDVLIKMPGRNYEKASKLSKNGSLLGWCFQTASFLAPFLGDKCYVCRGNVYFHKKKYGGYYHSWLELDINGKRYVFDPCLNFLGLKESYYIILGAEVDYKISSDEIEEYLVNLLSSDIENDIFINYDNKIDIPFYRTSASVSGVVKNGKILSLKPKYLLRSDYSNMGR